MHKKALGITVLFLLVVGGALFWLAKPHSSSSTPPGQASSQTSGAQPAPTKPGKYVTYDAQSFNKDVSTRILFFHAPWCPQCRALDTSIKSGNIPAGVTIYKVDYDSNQALRQKYGVTLQTTLVKVASDGNKEQLYVAYDNPNLQTLIDKLL